MGSSSAEFLFHSKCWEMPAHLGKAKPCPQCCSSLCLHSLGTWLQAGELWLMLAPLRQLSRGFPRSQSIYWAVSLCKCHCFQTEYGGTNLTGETGNIWLEVLLYPAFGPLPVLLGCSLWSVREKSLKLNPQVKRQNVFLCVQHLVRGAVNQHHPGGCKKGFLHILRVMPPKTTVATQNWDICGLIFEASWYISEYFLDYIFDVIWGCFYQRIWEYIFKYTTGFETVALSENHYLSNTSTAIYYYVMYECFYRNE